MIFTKLKIELLIKVYLLHRKNKISIIIIKNVESKTKIKYIDIEYHYIYKLFDNKEVEIEWICSTSILAEIFTKALSANDSNAIKTYR